MNRFACGVLLCITLSSTSALSAQHTPQSDSFSRRNTFTLFAEDSPTSSHMLLGAARQRILADFGGAYTRRVVRFWGSDLGYQIELRPVLFESDPLDIEKDVYTLTEPLPIGTRTFTVNSSYAPTGKCVASVTTGPFGLPGETRTSTITCGRQWTFGQSFSPLGFKYSISTHHPLQPFIVGTLGYMYTSRPVPVANAEAFNFVFDIGAGLELFRSEKKKRSVAIEARYHHFSNRDTAPANPGTDSIAYKLSYSFGH